MRSFAQKTTATQQANATKGAMPDRGHLEEPRDVKSILDLRRTIGNQAEQGLLERTTESCREDSTTTGIPRFGHDFSQIPVRSSVPVGIQSKLAVGTPGDIYEQEADRVADQVMNMPERQGQHRIEEKGEKLFQSKPFHVPDTLKAERSGDNTSELSPDKINSSVRGSQDRLSIDFHSFEGRGQPLPEKSQAFFESRMGYDFSQVRIHTDKKAVDAAQAIQARAFTRGQDIMFGKGQYSPNTVTGRQLLAHELTHTVQQRTVGMWSGAIQRKAAMVGSLPPEPMGGPPPKVPRLPGEPQQQWTEETPYIWFDLRDLDRQRQGPYKYSSEAYVNRVVNQDFKEDLKHPARVNDQPDQGWYINTRFFVDTIDSPLPSKYTRFETSADIQFEPSAGGNGFSHEFSDKNPSYDDLRGTTPYPFGYDVWDNMIKEPGTLKWDARLLVATSKYGPKPLAIEVVPPKDSPEINTKALQDELLRLGLTIREPAEGEAAPHYRVYYTKQGNDFIIHIELDGREFKTLNAGPKLDPSVPVGVPALVIAVFEDTGSTFSPEHVEIKAKQRIPFELPKSAP